ncbi:phosphoribosylglycinamide formyltransferase [Aquibacillus kalidii]|uniref:phosphoribosylglycinamide formyltransferase n=1 Tax=Aquibacillus kalidii TaxID=2762597 RepID=UPI0016456CF9|nr:phosphoribosylglycinamide formyltransferase [Aquibacillus kalidii]
MAKSKIAVFASGTGSNYDAIINQINTGTLDCEVALLICDKPEAEVIKKAKINQTPVFTFNPKQYESKALFEKEIVFELKQRDIEWIILAGYMRLIGPTLLSEYESRIVNIHPSLLPAFPGKDAIGQAFEAGVRVTGVTIHFVDEGMDTGEIIDQEAVRVDLDDTRLTLQQKVQKVEHRLYPQTIQKLITNQNRAIERGTKA